MQKKLLLISTLTFTGMTVVMILLFLKSHVSAELSINEISFTNNNGNDWIEIYNPGLNTKSLQGLYLTDKKEEYTKYEIKKNIVIAPKGFVVIYGKNYEGADETNITKTNFAIKNGETIYLVNQNQKAVDSLIALTSEHSTAETTIGRFPDGRQDTFEMSTPTMGARNKKDLLSQIMPTME